MRTRQSIVQERHKTRGSQPRCRNIKCRRNNIDTDSVDSNQQDGKQEAERGARDAGEGSRGAVDIYISFDAPQQRLS